jgi:hypothetical protein
MKALLAVAAIAIGLTGFQAPGQDKARKRDLKDRADIPGTIVCIGCTLEKESGADAQCTLHSKHAQGLLASDGTLWTFVDNAKGHLVAGNDKLRGREVMIFGWKYAKSQYIEVFKYQVKDGDKWVAWDYCKTCGFEKGDNKDTDLCEDCKK